jgi:geranylgeranyl reductase family protein
MDSCDVLVVGGGPAGSSCAWKLRQAGLDVVVMDRAAFPRDKVCAGWITPQVVDALRLDLDDYRRRRTLQVITGFRTGVIGDDRELETGYDEVVSFGIRRCEFDHYLLCRSGARVRTAAPAARIRREKRRWIVNDTVSAPLLVGAGGHFCPVARRLNPTVPRESLVIAQEAEFAIPDEDRDRWSVVPERPELYYCDDLKGYGWCFRKGAFLNIGLGRLDSRSLPQACADFVRFLERRRRIPRGSSLGWRGHAYLVSDPPRRRVVDEGVLLIGDAAGLAYSQSGEGIRPAIESGLLAASAVLGARRVDDPAVASSYERRLQERFGLRSTRGGPIRRMVPDLSAALGPRLLRSRWFVRHFVLDRWFLHASEPALSV